MSRVHGAGVGRRRAFITMLLIPIQVIRDLGIAASVGVAVVILLTNLVLLPVLMS